MYGGTKEKHALQRIFLRIVPQRAKAARKVVSAQRVEPNLPSKSVLGEQRKPIGIRSELGNDTTHLTSENALADFVLANLGPKRGKFVHQFQSNRQKQACHPPALVARHDGHERPSDVTGAQFPKEIP